MKWLVSAKNTHQKKWEEIFVYGTLNDAMEYAAQYMASPIYTTKIEIRRVHSSTCFVLIKSYEIL